MKSSKAMDEWVATVDRWQKSPFEVGQEGIDMAESRLGAEERQAIMDDRDSIIRGDYPKGWGPTPVAPTPATATLIQCEWKAVNVTQYGDAFTLNALFADGWQFDSVAGDVYLLKRQVTQE